MRVGVLTGGGDCPGLNAVIRAVVRKGVKAHGHEFVGFRDGWRGPLENDTMTARHPRGARHPAARRHDPRLVAHQPVRGRGRGRADQGEPRRQRLRRADRDRRRGHARRRDQAGRARRQRRRRAEDHRQRPVRHRLHLRLRHRGQHRDGGDRPAAHHRRVAPPRARRRGDGPPRRLDRPARGLAGGANIILIPERPFDIDKVCAQVESRFATHYSPIIVVAEGAMPKEGTMELVSGEKDAFGHVRLGGIGDRLAKEIEERTGKEARAVVLGHIQRGGTPTAFDRWLATRFGLHAIQAVTDERLRHDGRPARHRDRPGAARRGHRRARRSSGPSCTTRPRSFG